MNTPSLSFYQYLSLITSCIISGSVVICGFHWEENEKPQD